MSARDRRASARQKGMRAIQLARSPDETVRGCVIMMRAARKSQCMGEVACCKEACHAIVELGADPAPVLAVWDENLRWVAREVTSTSPIWQAPHLQGRSPLRILMSVDALAIALHARWFPSTLLGLLVDHTCRWSLHAPMVESIDLEYLHAARSTTAIPNEQAFLRAIADLAADTDIRLLPIACRILMGTPQSGDRQPTLPVSAGA